MKDAPLIFIFFGVVLLWAGLTGRFGAILAAIFEPDKLGVQ